LHEIKMINKEIDPKNIPEISEDYRFLDFEKTIQDISEKITALKNSAIDSSELNNQINTLRKKRDVETKKIYSKLSIWQTVQVARHPQRPHTLDFIDRIFDDFDELHGDRQFGDDASIIGGIAYLENMPVMIIGHEKGRDTEEKVRRNFGMPQPEGYRKAKRLMELAEQFTMPVITFIDTAGAYPGIEGEERGQSEAIARNLAVMSELKTPILVVVTGEGGSGGALAISVGDNIAMLQYATYSVASPEACASIIWRTADKASDAAEAMKVSANELKKLKIIDEIIEEPLGGAHRDYDLISSSIKDSLIKNLSALNIMSMEQLLDRRYKRLVEIGI
jgi:acetyl-CoA carboxylase carboxyl transferase subunit alpha